MLASRKKSQETENNYPKVLVNMIDFNKKRNTKKDFG